MNVVSKKIHRLHQSGLFSRSNVIIFNGHGGLILPGQNANRVDVSCSNNIKPTTLVCNQINQSPRLYKLLQSCSQNMNAHIRNIVICNSDKNFTFDAHYEGCFTHMNEVFIFSHPCEHGLIGDISKTPYLSERFKRFSDGCDNVNIVLKQDEKRLIEWFDHLSRTSQIKFQYQ